MKHLFLLSILISPAVNAVDLADATKQLCKDHPVKVQCEELVSSMLVNSYVIGQTQLGCELGIVDACKAKSTSDYFEYNVRWLEKRLSNP
ncbi:hypothetical protein OMDBNIEC_00011 [Salmonella phage STP-SP5]|nr:hypothetical protein OMDBNIEC_00011 [Salmonella phage STP-SP5]